MFLWFKKLKTELLHFATSLQKQYFCSLLLRETNTIQKTIAFFLLIVFAISGAPEGYFHDALANHKDFQACTDNSTAAHFHQAGINCHFDELVVSSLYHFSVEPFGEFSICFFHTKHQPIEASHLLQASISKESRGPPAV